jgi:hypothetical protein
MAKRRTPPSADAPVGFKTVFWVVVAMSGASLVAALYLAQLPPERHTDTLRGLVTTCDTTWKTGFGGVLGLLGGKRLP